MKARYDNPDPRGWTGRGLARARAWARHVPGIVWDGGMQHPNFAASPINNQEPADTKRTQSDLVQREMEKKKRRLRVLLSRRTACAAHRLPRFCGQQRGILFNVA